jgi:hypothetical protein
MLAANRHAVADRAGKGGRPVSVEAISWALNLALVPRDCGGKRNAAFNAPVDARHTAAALLVKQGVSIVPLGGSRSQLGDDH